MSGTTLRDFERATVCRCGHTAHWHRSDGGCEGSDACPCDELRLIPAAVLLDALDRIAALNDRDPGVSRIKARRIASEAKA